MTKLEDTAKSAAVENSNAECLSIRPPISTQNLDAFNLCRCRYVSGSYHLPRGVKLIAANVSKILYY